MAEFGMHWYIDGYNNAIDETEKEVLDFIEKYMSMIDQPRSGLIEGIKKIYEEKRKSKQSE